MKWAVLALILVLTYITWRQTTREHACPAAAKLTAQAIKDACDNLGGVVQGEQCVCPDGSPST